MRLFSKSLRILFILIFFSGGFCYGKEALSPPFPIYLKKEKSGCELIFRIPKDKQFAIFSLKGRWYIIFDGEVPLTFPGKENLYPLIQSLTLLPQKTINTKDKTTVIEMLLNPNIVFSYERRAKGLYLTFNVRERLLKKDFSSSKIEYKKNTNRLEIEGVLGAKEGLCEIENNRYFIVFSNGKSFLKLNKSQEFDRYKTEKSLVGLVFKLYTDYVFFSKKENKLILETPNNVSAVITKENLPTFSYFSADRAVDWMALRAELEISLLKNKNNLEKKLELAWVEIALARGIEASVMLEDLKSSFPTLGDAPFFQAMEGMAYFLREDYEKALLLWESIVPTDELILLKDITSFFLYKTIPDPKGLEKSLILLEQYTVPLKKFILKKIWHILKNSHLSPQLLSDLAEPKLMTKEDDLQELSQFYQAFSIFSSGLTLDAAQLMEKLLDQDREKGFLPTDIKQEAEFIYLLGKKNTFSKKELIHQYSLLYSISSSSPIAYYIGKEIADLLKQDDQLFELFNLRDSLIKNHPERSSLDGMGQIFQEELYNFFSNYMDKYSALKNIALYERYRNIIEEGEAEETIIKKIASQFQEVGLLESAANILTKWSKTIKKEEKRIETLLEVASIFMEDFKYDSVLVTLENISLDQLTKKQKKKYLDLKAHSLLKRKRSIEALNLLKESSFPDHKEKTGKIYIQYKRWPEATEKFLELYGIFSKDLDKNAEAIKRVLDYLAITLYLGNQNNKIKDIRIGLRIPKGISLLFDYVENYTIDNNNNTRENIEKRLSESDKLIDVFQKEIFSHKK